MSEPLPDAQPHVPPEATYADDASAVREELKAIERGQPANVIDSEDEEVSHYATGI